MTVSTDRENPSDASILRLTLPRNSEAPAVARAAIATFSADRDIDTPTLATLTLLVSEIVTNAVIHPDMDEPNELRLNASIGGGLIRVEVTDGGGGFTPRPRDPARVGGGYGLYLLNKASSRWGVETRPNTTVWFELNSST